MANVIIHKGVDGILRVTRPAPGVDIHTVARQAVLSGHPYKIVDDSEIPTDRTFRAAWTADDVDLTDGVGNESNLLE